MIDMGSGCRAEFAIGRSEHREYNEMGYGNYNEHRERSRSDYRDYRKKDYINPKADQRT